ncbi:MAG: histidine phosphatase family protein [Pseudomonadota bacterium]
MTRTSIASHLNALFLLALTALAAFAPSPAAADPLPQAGHVLMLRHAYAPGIGDPPGFRLDDCASQRNLDASGRAQAAAVGDWLRAQGVRQARVHSSQWCRCQETARLLGLGAVTPTPALNSFFGEPQARDGTLQALRAFLAQQPADGPLLVLVTHQVNIAAVTGRGIGSGEGVLLAREPGGELRVVRTLDFGATSGGGRARG